MGTSAVELSRTYTSFAGCDIRVVVEGESLGQAQAVSYAVQREKAPIYVLGRADPLSFSRGKRGIAGTLITLMLDRHVLYHKTFEGLKFIADKDEIFASVNDLNDATTTNDLNEVGGGDPLAPTFDETDVTSNYQLNKAWYVDQLPPFDITIVAANEYGAAAQMRIYGVEILNEGSGFSIDDIVIENQMTYVCRTILPWRPMGKWDMTSGAFGPAAPV